METDYYPRLSAVNSDNGKIRLVVEQQAIIALLLLMPVIVIFLIFSPFVIKLLFSNKFVEITQMVNFAIMGTYFRAVSWSIGFILFAKGESKLLIKTGFGFNTIFLINNILGYYLYGLTGLGFSFIVNYLFHLIVMFYIAKFRYSFYLDRNFIVIFFSGVLLCTAGFLITLFSNQLLRYSLGMIMISGVAFYSFAELDKRLNVKGLISSYISKKRT
jgi:O-antigen/teichoic acid export membrane protein